LSKGLIHIYTGEGKGKTTSAIGLAVRACGHGWNVLMIQFMKGHSSKGEFQILKNIPNFEFVQTGLPSFIQKGSPTVEDIQLAQEGVLKAQKAVISGNYDLVILDEIHMAIDFGLVQLEEIINLIQNKSTDTELVLTGRNAPPELVKLSDYVSEILDIKHPYHHGKKNRRGIEY